MFGANDGGLLVLTVLMTALGLVPALMALSSGKAPMPGRDRPAAPTHRFHFGAATAARWGH